VPELHLREHAAGSKLRKLMVDDAVGTYDFANLLDGAQLDKYPKDFLAEVLVSGGKRGDLGKMGKRYVEWVKERLCEYRDHEGIGEATR
jgi:hypothetical protein